MKPVLTIVSVNYNSADFLSVGLKALKKLTINPWKSIICDNGSVFNDFKKLRKCVSDYENVFLLSREQKSIGSIGHGEALNMTTQFIDTPYGVIMDADCIPLIHSWDEMLINMIDSTCKIAGTPLAVNTPKTDKPKDFPLMFLCVFETETFKKLEIDFRPKDVSKFQDTGWELREKYKGAGFKGHNLFGLNTRSYKEGPFKNTICDEYYSDEHLEKLVCAHFGRGSNPGSGKYGKTTLRRVLDRHLHRKDRKRWLSICERVIYEQKMLFS